MQSPFFVALFQVFPCLNGMLFLEELNLQCTQVHMVDSWLQRVRNVQVIIISMREIEALQCRKTGNALVDPLVPNLVVIFGGIQWQGNRSWYKKERALGLGLAGERNTWGKKSRQGSTMLRSEYLPRLLFFSHKNKKFLGSWCTWFSPSWKL